LSRQVRIKLKAIGYYFGTTHEERIEMDREIERRKHMNCDRAMELGLVSDEEFREIVELILKRKKKKKEVVPAIV